MMDKEKEMTPFLLQPAELAIRLSRSEIAPPHLEKNGKCVDGGPTCT